MTRDSSAMTMPQPSVTGDLVGSLGRTAGRLLRRLVAMVVRERERRRAIRQLRAMDPAMLRDLGITRSEIEAVVRFGHADRLRRRFG